MSKISSKFPDKKCDLYSGIYGKPLLHPIPVQRPFQILGNDVMDLPVTENGNRDVVVVPVFARSVMEIPYTRLRGNPSFLLFGVDCRSSNEAAYLPAVMEPSKTIEDY
jgi:hypothetical protein